MRQTLRYFGAIVLFFSLVLCGLSLTACGSSGQESSSTDEVSSSATIEVSGEIINVSRCSVLLPDGWTNTKNTDKLIKGDPENLEFIEISMSKEEFSENLLQACVENELDPRNPRHRRGSFGEDITIAGITFKTIKYEDQPQYGLYGLKNGKMLEIDLSNISLDDSVLEAIIDSIEFREEKSSEKDSSNTEPESKAAPDPSTYIEEGLPLSLTVNGQEYTITDISWTSIIANAKAYHGIVLEGTGFSANEVYPLRCEIIRNGNTATPELMVNSSGQTAFTFAFANDNNKPDTVVIWAVDAPDNRYTFALK